MTSLTDRLHRLAQYPTFAMYVAGVLVACGVSVGWIRLDVGVVALSVIAVLLITVGISREVHTVHTLVNSQRDELLERIDQLLDALHEAGVTVPKDPEREDRDHGLREGDA